MDTDTSISTDQITEGEVVEAIRVIHILSSAFGDERNNLYYLARILEVLYGVTYEVDDSDIENLAKVMSAINPEDAQRLDPTHVEEKSIQAEQLLHKVDEYDEHELFDSIPVVSRTNRED